MSQDAAILRDLFSVRERLIDACQSSVGQWRDINMLKPVRPVVHVMEHPWHEMDVDGSLACRCADPILRSAEAGLRRDIYCLTHTPGDMVLSNVIETPLYVNDTGLGVTVDEKILKIDDKNHIVAHEFHPQMFGIEDVAKIKDPVLTLDTEKTKAHYEKLCEAMGDAGKVRVVGRKGAGFSPWDTIIKWTGVEAALVALYEDPDFIHALMKRYTEASLIGLDRAEAIGALASNACNVRVGSGGYGYCEDLADPETLLTGAPASQMWGFATAQIFSDVSPKMHDEFALAYERQWLSRFGLSYYGCCEPLHTKFHLLENIRGLRKVSISPWCDISAAAEFCKGRYVMSVKPSPAIFLTDNWTEENATRQIENILEKTEGCAVEIIMKDISTVAYHPHRLWVWEQIARECLDRRYG